MNSIHNFPKLLLPLLAAVILLLAPACQRDKQKFNTDNLPPIKGEVMAKLTVAPEVPPRIQAKTNTKVIVHLEIVEQVMRLADGVEYNF